MIKKIINRNPIKSKKIYFKKGKNINSENINNFKKKYNVDKIIRLLDQDFKLIKKSMNKFMHFSIQQTAHEAGQNCLLVKIYKKGYFNGRVYKQPILYNNNFILTKCLSAENNIDYTNLKKKDFKYSLSNIKNVYSLKKAIIRRYKKSLSHLSNSKKLSLGIATTELKIIKRF